jgi:hypothetical protein
LAAPKLAKASPIVSPFSDRTFGANGLISVRPICNRFKRIASRSDLKPEHSLPFYDTRAN